MARITKCFCDRCGKEIKKTIIPKTKEVVFDFSLSKWGSFHNKYEICLDCSKAFLKFMNDEDCDIQDAEIVEDEPTWQE